MKDIYENFQFLFQRDFVRKTFGTILITIFTSGSFYTDAGKYRTFKYIWMYTYM